MKRSTSVVLSSVMSAGIAFAAAGCASDYEEVRADNQEICIEQATGERVPDANCDSGGSGGRYHHWYHGSSHGPAPAVGSKINPAHGSSVRPAGGTISRPPATGGFGTSKVSSGS